MPHIIVLRLPSKLLLMNPDFPGAAQMPLQFGLDVFGPIKNCFGR
jgi:hypothetical protein